MPGLYAFSSLSVALETVVREHPKASEPSAPPPEDRLSQLIAMILAAPVSDRSAVAKSLSNDDATILIHAFERDLAVEHHEILGDVLALRPLPRQLAQAWVVLRNHATRRPLYLAMQKIASKIEVAAVQSDPTLLRLHRIWSAELGPKALVADMEETTHTRDAWLTESWPRPMDVDVESPLAIAMGGFLLAYADREVLLRHELTQIEGWFEYLVSGLVEPAAVNYLNQLESDEWVWSRVERWVEKYGLPAAGGAFWDQIDRRTRDEIQRHVAGRMIAEFFDDVDDPERRFEFWCDYTYALVGIAYPENRQRVLLKFRKVIVVEFRDIGNAGYIYDEVDTARIEPLVVGWQEHGACKNRLLVRHRIIHTSGWQFQAREYLDRVLPRK